LRAICIPHDDGSLIDPERLDDAIAFMALCVGGISLARAVDDPVFAQHILDRLPAGGRAYGPPDNASPTHAEGPDHARTRDDARNDEY
jgi:hypothetical protein